MPKFLIQGNYIGDGIKGLLKEGGSGRRKAVEQAVGSLGGRLESMYYAFGETDVFAIIEMPDNASMASAALLVGASGAVDIKTTVLMSPEDVDEAAKKTPEYRPPGK